ncbi:MAG: hypothetical protein ACP5MG_10790 [Verrucomicrobiia bacterium]
MRGIKRAFFLLVALAPCIAQAYPEFHKFIVQRSGRIIDCAYCHTHPDGPEGTDFGQIGRLTPAELEQLGRARAAFNPGSKVYNPILNDFGDYLINTFGKKRILEFRIAPEALIKELPKEDDLDNDGIPNYREMADGTHPLNNQDGDPWLLFINNLQKNLFHIVLLLIATILGLYGLRHLLISFSIYAEAVSNKDNNNK